MHEPEREGEANHSQHQIPESIGNVRVEKSLDVATHKTRSQAAEPANKIAGNINSDRIHSHPDERLPPGLFFTDIHDPIKDTQENRAVTADNKNIRGGPDFLYHRKLESSQKRRGPKPPEQDAAHPE